MTTQPPLEGVILAAPEEPGGIVQIKGREPREIFTTPGVPQAIVAMIQGAAKQDFTPDLTTEKGRKEIASLAFRVSRTKTYLDELGKEAVAALKEVPKQIDAGRKVVRDGLDALRDEIRKPLDDWEAAEQTRVTRHQFNLQDLQEIPRRTVGQSAAVIGRALAKLQVQVIGEDWQEFQGEAGMAHAAALEALALQHQEAVTREAEQAELAKLREEKAKREAADLARERDAMAAAEAQVKAERDREEAVRRAQEAEEAAERRAREAVETERRRAEQERLQREAEAAAELAKVKKAAEDVEHRALFNREALADLEEIIACTVTPPGESTGRALGVAILTAIVRLNVRHVSITY